MTARKSHFDGGFPITLFILIVGLLLQFCVLVQISNIGKILFYSVFTFVFFYILLLRYACKLKVSSGKLEIIYFFPWDNNVIVDLSKVESVDFANGFFHPFSNQSLGGLFVFPKYCYDQYIFQIKDKEDLLTVNINTRLFQFGKCFKLIKSIVKK